MKIRDAAAGVLLPILLKALKDSEPKVRVHAALSIEKLQAAEAIPDLVAALGP